MCASQRGKVTRYQIGISEQCAEYNEIRMLHINERPMFNVFPCFIFGKDTRGCKR